MVGGLLERNLQVHLTLTIFHPKKREPFYSLLIDNLSQYVKSNLVPGEIVSACCYLEILRRNHAGFRSIAVLEALKSDRLATSAPSFRVRRTLLVFERIQVQRRERTITLSRIQWCPL